MTIIEAFKTGKPVKRNKAISYQDERRKMTVEIHPDAYVDPSFLLKHVHFSIEDILSDQWEVKE